MSYKEEVKEGLLGSLFAVEGVKNSITILNGPTGCKFYPSSVSEAEHSRRGAFNPYLFSDEFFFCQPRIPCTYMDGDDLVMGTDEKLNRLYEKAVAMHPDIIGMVNSPGGSLIGSHLDLKNDKGVVTVSSESPGFSVRYGQGYQDMTVRILEQVMPADAVKKDRTVNLLGLSIDDLNWQDTIDDLTSLLAMCNIKVIAASVNWSVDDIRRSACATANIVLSEEIGGKVAEWYADRFGTAVVDAGIPLGFDNLEKWIEKVCKAVGTDPSPALDAIKECRHRAAAEIRRLNIFSGRPAGCTFSVSAPGNITLAVLTSLHSYLGMMPVAVECTDGARRKEISAYLKDYAIEVSDDAFNTPADVYLGDGTVLSSLQFRGLIGGGVCICNPCLKGVMIAREPILGLEGTMRLLDSVMNALDKV
jgi:nitrogenase molybdenum-iron protein alpha/beta subunit